MSEAATTAMLTTADGRPLKEALATAQARARRKAFLLVLPLLLFVLLTFLIPIGYMLKRSVEHDGFSASAPELDAWFAANPGLDYANPPEAAYAALVKDLARMQVEKSTGIAGTRINLLAFAGADADIDRGGVGFLRVHRRFSFLEAVGLGVFGIVRFGKSPCWMVSS